MPGHPISIMGAIDDPVNGCVSLDGNVYKFMVHQYGDIGGETKCEQVGEEFNNLKEVIYGIQNPYQDPSRGTIES